MLLAIRYGHWNWFQISNQQCPLIESFRNASEFLIVQISFLIQRSIWWLTLPFLLLTIRKSILVVWFRDELIFNIQECNMRDYAYLNCPCEFRLGIFHQFPILSCKLYAIYAGSRWNCGKQQHVLLAITCRKHNSPRTLRTWDRSVLSLLQRSKQSEG